MSLHPESGPMPDAVQRLDQTGMSVSHGELRQQFTVALAEVEQERLRLRGILAARSRELTRLAFHDTLTGLPNRALFSDRLQQAVVRSERHKEPLAVLFLDLDNFKLVNDSIRHEAGDRLLIAVAERLRGCLRAEDTVARFGGDEMAILIEGPADYDEVVAIAERIAATLKPPIGLSVHELFVTASIGIALANPGVENAESLLRKADLAMYRAKASGKAQHTVFGQSMNAAALERLQLGSDLHLAIERNELQLMYQPSVTLDDQAIGELEALGCDRGQGYLLARPLTAEALTDLLHSTPRKRPEPADSVPADVAPPAPW